MPKTRLALIGLGMAAKPHCLALRDLSDQIEVVTAFSRSAERRAAAARDWGLPVVDDLDRLIADRSIDAALILTPPTTHLDLVKRCAAAGKHVLLEKPIEVTLALAEETVSVAEQAGIRLAIVFQHRFRPRAITLARVIAEGRLGPLLSASAAIRWWRGPDYYAQEGRGMKARDGGGVLLTQAIHTLDLFLALVGEPVREVAAFAATSRLRRIDTEDVVAGALRFANGAVGAIDATTLAYPGFPERIEIVGEHGTALIEGEGLTIAFKDGTRLVEGTAASAGGGADPMAFDHGPHRALIADFLAAIVEERPPVTNGRGALAVHRLIDSLLRSSESRRPVTLDCP